MPQTKPKQDGWEDVQAGDGWSDVSAPKPVNKVNSAASLAAPNRTASRRIAQAQPNVTTQQRADSPIGQGVDKFLTAAPVVAGLGLTGAGLVAAPLEAAGGLVGAYAGKHGGRFIAKELGGGEDVQDIAGVVGGVGGGLAGGLGAHRLEIPEKVNLPFGIKFRTPSWLNPVDTRPSQGEVVDRLKPWSKPSQGEAIDSRKPWGMMPQNERIAQTKMPTEEPYTPYKPGPSAGLDPYSPNRSIGTPITGRSGVGPASSTAGVRRPFSGFVGSAPPAEEGVSVVPEPRPLFPGEQPNYEASVPRDELLGQAQQRKPGAAKQLQQIGKTILYKPKPTIGRR